MIDRKRNYLIAILIAVSIIFPLSLLLLSYSNAKTFANEIMAPTKPIWGMTECNFTVLSFEHGRPVHKRNGLGWQVLYNTDDFFTNNLELYISLTGKLVATNPVDLLERIDRSIKKE